MIRALAVVVLVAGAAFWAGRESAGDGPATAPRGTFAAGHRQGLEDAFSGFDGGWSYGAPYIVTLRRGGPGVTYRFSRRRPMVPGRSYRVCGRAVCSRSGG